VGYLGRLLAPRSVAVVGASPDGSVLRGRLTRTLLLHPFAGTVHLVSRSHPEILGRATLPSLSAIDVPVDLAVVLTPAAAVPDALEEAAACGIGAAVVIASGFAEEGSAEGRAMQAQIAEIAARHDMAVMGPNSEGFVNAALGLCPTFSPVCDVPLEAEPWGAEMFGSLAIVAQSGALGFGFFDLALQRGLPVSHVITTGNEACLGLDDYLEWLLDSTDAAAFALFVEDVRDGPRFMKLAERALDERRPIALAKVGASEAGGRSAVSHTGALAGSDAAYEAVFRRLGVARARGMDELIDTAAALARWRHMPPAGRRVGIASSSGGAAGWLADVCTGEGLEVPLLDPAARARIDAVLPPYGSSANPVDATAQAIYRVGYAGFIEMLASAGNVDMVAMVSTLKSTRIVEAERETLAVASRAATKPVVMWSYTTPAPLSREIVTRAGIPVMATMENAARALVALDRFGSAIARRGVPPAPPPRADAAVAVRLEADGPVLCEAVAREVLAAWGLPVGAAELATDAAAAVAAWRAFGGPVALKLQSPGVPHKTEAGGVRLGLDDSEDVAEAFEGILAAARRHAPDAELLGVLVQPMAAEGVEVIVGARHDVRFGPMVLVGLGGILAETIGDTVLQPAPVTAAEAREMIAGLRGARVLQGVRGRPPADTAALAELVAAVSGLAAAHGEAIAEIDLNPVIVHERGLTLADALIVGVLPLDKPGRAVPTGNDHDTGAL
jgi:acyl-CoA synthetase (NDP forming)